MTRRTRTSSTRGQRHPQLGRARSHQVLHLRDRDPHHKPEPGVARDRPALTIDGYTQGDLTATADGDAKENTLQQGTSAVLKIELNGENAGDAKGFVVTDGGTTIRGLVINRFNRLDTASFDGCGIFPPNLASDTGNVIKGDFLGTDVTGNDLPGVLAFGQSVENKIGGTTLASRNLVSGDGGYGVAVDSGQNEVRGT